MKAIQKQTHTADPSESYPAVGSVPLFVRQLSPEMRELLDKHFWCDFSDIIPTMAWDTLPDRKN